MRNSILIIKPLTLSQSSPKVSYLWAPYLCTLSSLIHPPHSHPLPLITKMGYLKTFEGSLSLQKYFLKGCLSPLDSMCSLSQLILTTSSDTSNNLAKLVYFVLPEYTLCFPLSTFAQADPFCWMVPSVLSSFPTSICCWSNLIHYLSHCSLLTL